jgi:hypothetical protein
MNEIRCLVRKSTHCLLFCLIATAAGCGETNLLKGLKVYPVKGKVTLPDGKPLTSGTITFVATKSTITSSTNIESDGSFIFKGGANGDGLPEGDYKVRLDAAYVSGQKIKKGTLPFPSKYVDEDGSDLTATVKPDDSNNIELKLTPNASRAAAAKHGGH